VAGTAVTRERDQVIVKASSRVEEGHIGDASRTSNVERRTSNVERQLSVITQFVRCGT